jgi:hypothetical protein
LSFDFEKTSGIKENFVWSDLELPSELRDKWLLPFEAAMKTIRVEMRGPTNGEWILRFTDLEKPTKMAGVYEEYIYHIRTHLENRLWEIYTLQSPPFRRTIGGLVKFVPKMGYALLPPSFVKDLIESYNPYQELTFFKAERDYFSIEVSNPSERIRRNFAEMSYKSSNVPEDFVVLVEKKPVGPLLLTRADFRITYHSSKERTCKIRMEIDGKLSQVGRGDSDIFLEVRNRVLKYLSTQCEKTLLSTPSSRIDVVEHAESGTKIISKEITQPSEPILIKLSRPVDQSAYRKIVSIFTQNSLHSNFFGIVERESETESLIRITDAEGGGDALLQIHFSKDLILINPLSTTTIRTLNRIYHVILEKLDVDTILTHLKEE